MLLLGILVIYICPRGQIDSRRPGDTTTHIARSRPAPFFHVKGSPRLRKPLAAGLLLTAALATGCSTATTTHHHGTVKLPVGPPGTSASGILRLGYVLDVPDAPALVGTQMGYYQQALGKVSLQPQAFTSQALEITAIETGQLDAAYLDPVTAVTLSQRLHGGLRIIAGAALGGTELVVNKTITQPSQLKNRQLAAPAGTPQTTADTWLRANGLPPLTQQETAPSTDAAILHEFTAGTIAGAWEPAPLDTELTAAGGRVLATTRDSNSPTLVLAVTENYLTSHRAAVANLVKGQLQADKLLAASPVPAEAAFQQKLAQADDAALPPAELTASFAQVTFTDNPQEPAVRADVQEALTAGLIKPVTNWSVIFDLTQLNSALRSTGHKQIGS
jgi:NitT/TauT family transport system substrate-binding protein